MNKPSVPAISGSSETLPAPADFNLFSADHAQLAGIRRLPQSLSEAKAAAKESAFVHAVVPPAVIHAYCDR